MRILHVITSLAEADGGPPQGLVSLAKAQSQAGDEIVILAGTSMGGQMVIEPGEYGNLRVLNPPASTSLKFPSSILKKSLLEAVKNADVVHMLCQKMPNFHLEAGLIST